MGTLIAFPGCTLPDAEPVVHQPDLGPVERVGDQIDASRCQWAKIWRTLDGHTAIVKVTCTSPECGEDDCGFTAVVPQSHWTRQ